MTTAEVQVQSGFKMTELGELSEDWEVKKIKDIGKVVTGTTPSTKKKEYYGSEYQFISPADLGKTKYVYLTAKYLSEKGLSVSRALPKDSVMLTCIGSTIGKVGMSHEALSATNQQINSIICHEKHDAHFIYYLMSYRIDFIRSIASTVAVPILNKGNFENIKIPLPPLPEQKKIAAVLSAVQEVKEKTEAVINATKELKKSIMKHLFTYGAVPLEDAEKVPLKETEIGMIPEEWDVNDLGSLIQGTQYGLSKAGRKKGQYPILRMNNLKDGCVDIKDLQYVDLDENNFNKFKLNNNDILFNRTNSYELVGKTSMFNIDGDFVFASYLIRVVPDTNQLLSDYLNYYFNWELTQKRLKMLASRGVSQSNISATKLRGFSIPLPPLPVQEKIASILSAVDAKIQAEENKKKALGELFKTLLSNLMTAKFRVNNLKLKAEVVNG